MTISPKDYLRPLMPEEIRGLGLEQDEVESLEKESLLGVLVENYLLRRGGEQGDPAISASLLSRAVDVGLTEIINKTYDGRPIAYLDEDIGDMAVRVRDLHHIVPVPDPVRGRQHDAAIDDVVVGDVPEAVDLHKASEEYGPVSDVVADDPIVLGNGECDAVLEDALEDAVSEATVLDKEAEQYAPVQEDTTIDDAAADLQKKRGRKPRQKRRGDDYFYHRLTSGADMPEDDRGVEDNILMDDDEVSEPEEDFYERPEPRRQIRLSKERKKLVSKLEVMGFGSRTEEFWEKVYNIYPEEKRAEILAKYGEFDDISDTLDRIDAKFFEDDDLKGIVSQLTKGQVEVFNYIGTRSRFEMKRNPELRGGIPTASQLITLLEKAYHRKDEVKENTANWSVAEYFRQIGFGKTNPRQLNSLYQCHPNGKNSSLLRHLGDTIESSSIESLLEKLPKGRQQVLGMVAKKIYEMSCSRDTGIMPLLQRLQREYGTVKESRYRLVSVDSAKSGHAPTTDLDIFRHPHKIYD